jgi:hypothetical protein
MGIQFDYIILAGPQDAVRCAHGHEIRDLQTKDLIQLMGKFYVWQGKLYLEQPSPRSVYDQPQVVSRYRLEGDSLIASRETTSLPTTAGEVTAYTSCKRCLPVLVESSEVFHCSLSEHYPRVQVVLRFDGGRLIDWRPDRVETRDDVRRRYPDAIPDDDRVARRHFKQLAEANRDAEGG